MFQAKPQLFVRTKTPATVTGVSFSIIMPDLIMQAPATVDPRGLEAVSCTYVAYSATLSHQILLLSFPELLLNELIEQIIRSVLQDGVLVAFSIMTSLQVKEHGFTLLSPGSPTGPE